MVLICIPVMLVYEVRRSFISFAALLVKVMLKIFSGEIPESKRYCILATKLLVFPLPALALQKIGEGAVIAFHCSWLSPYFSLSILL